MNLRDVPKAELHCHSDGVVDPAMLAELEAAGRNVGVSAKALAATLPVESFESWMRGYSRVVAPAFLPLEERNAWFLEAHISRLKAQNVSYAEIFLSGFLGVREDIGEMVELFRRLRASLVRAAAPDLEIELVACVGRSTPERLARQSPRILALWDAGLICGVSLAGDESLPLLPLRPFFERFRDSGLGIEIHAGETRGPESVWEALEHGFADRIGHGVSAFRDPALLEQMQRRKVHLEFCLTSNHKLGVIKDVSEHPLRQAVELGIPFSLNTDDPGPFQCSLTSEYELAERIFGLTEADFARILSDTMSARFQGRRSPKASRS